MTPESRTHQIVNQLVFATVAGTDADELTERLIEDGFYVTRIDSYGSFFQEATVSLLLGLDKTRLPQLLEHIRTCCHTRQQYLPAHIEGSFSEAQPVMIEAEVGGATVFAFDVERFEQL